MFNGHVCVILNVSFFHLILKPDDTIPAAFGMEFTFTQPAVHIVQYRKLYFCVLLFKMKEASEIPT